ncbi:MAG: alpha/beta hydrolase [Chloroflexota bacterium]|nr:alpha/beta hydrolase [Chloroflexota bacterium]
MSNRLILIPRWSGTPDSDWYPWLQRQLALRAPSTFDRVVVGDMPNPHLPAIEAWVAKVLELLGSDPEEIARTLLVGHSVGCLAILRTLARLPDGARVSGTLCVAGWFAVDQPWDSLRPWSNTPLDWEHARRAAGELVVLLSDNDPFTSDVNANRREWQQRLGATVHVVPGAQHFNHSRQPLVLETLLAMATDQENSVPHS